MSKERLNKTEVGIIRSFPHGEFTVSQIAEKLKVDVSWVSRCISHLEELGFLWTNRVGYKIHVSIADMPLGSALSHLLIEEPAMSLDALLGGSSLQILPLLLSPGYSTREIAERTGISSRTIQTRIKRWRGMGVIIYEDKKYKISPRHPLVIEFISDYSKHKNAYHLKERYSDATIIWQDRDEYIISIEREISDNIYGIAGATKIGYLGYDIVSRNYYYYYSPVDAKVSEVEALVQTVKFDMINPRPLRYIRQAIKNKKVKKSDLRKYAKKYMIEKKVEEAL